MTLRWLGALLIASIVAIGAPPASASECIFAPAAYHRVDAELQQVDTSAPGTPVVVGVAAYRRNGMTCTPTSCIATSCGNTGTVRIDLAPAADDVTPPHQLGYRLALASGVLPESMRALVGVNLAGDRPVLLRPTFDEVPSLDLLLTAVAIDVAGNESAPSEPFVVQFDGCTLAAVGDRCEDELGADTDLSALWSLGAGHAAEDGPTVAGAACTLTRPAAPASPLYAAALALGSLALRRARLPSRSARRQR